MMDSEVAFWIKEIDTYERDFGSWCERSKKIVERYRNDEKRKQNRFNILYSNVQTLAPALYSQQPKPNFERRFSGDDSVGRNASLVLERAVSYYIDNDEFDDCLQQTVLDRLLSGRGTSWVRYEPTFEGTLTDDEIPDLKYEDVRIDYVHWEDFGHTFGRTWQEIRAVWRKVYLSRRELIKRFGEEIGSAVPIGEESMSEESREKSTKACVYEIWDKTTKRAYWIVKGFERALDIKDDPLGLSGFFPCPRPLYSQVANDKLVPVPDYLQYQDQASELDMVTTRIDLIVKAIKVSGIYDASSDAIKQLLSQNAENKMIAVENWAVMGGLDKAVSFFPVEKIVGTLQQLYQSRESIKQTIYEITGISDIIRGSSVASETATAQNIKSQYATMRLGKSQKDVQRFCRDIIRIMAELIAEHFSLETLKQVSGVMLLTEQEKMQAQLTAQEGRPIDPRVERLMNEPTWEQVYTVLKDDMARCFRIDIETDSTIKADQDAEKASRAEFLTAVSQYIVQAGNVQDPSMKPLLLELMRFGVQGFRVGKTMEAEFNMVIDKARQEAMNPQEKPDPELAKMQAEQQQAQAEMQADQAKIQMEIQADVQKSQAEMQNAQLLKDMELQAQREIEQMKLQTQLQIENMRLEADVQKQKIQSSADVVNNMMSANNTDEKDGQNDTDKQAMMAEYQGMQEVVLTVLDKVMESQDKMIESLNKPKSISIADSNGKIVRQGTVQ